MLEEEVVFVGDSTDTTKYCASHEAVSGCQVGRIAPRDETHWSVYDPKPSMMSWSSQILI